jgi:hypothetical protein
MGKTFIILAPLIAAAGILTVSCVKNTEENKPLDTTVVGKWEGLIGQINTPATMGGASILAEQRFLWGFPPRIHSVWPQWIWIRRNPLCPHLW